MNFFFFLWIFWNSMEIWFLEENVLLTSLRIFACLLGICGFVLFEFWKLNIDIVSYTENGLRFCLLVYFFRDFLEDLCLFVGYCTSFGFFCMNFEKLMQIWFLEEKFVFDIWSLGFLLNPRFLGRCGINVILAGSIWNLLSLCNLWFDYFLYPILRRFVEWFQRLSSFVS